MTALRRRLVARLGRLVLGVSGRNTVGTRRRGPDPLVVLGAGSAVFPKDGWVNVLLIATSPRGTWITSPDSGTAERVEALLSGVWWARVAVRAFTVDVGIGVEAYEAGEVLMAAGYRFAWHDDQHPLNRGETAWGIPVTQ